MIAWFEIPVSNMDRAKKFYEEALGMTVSVQNINGLQMGWFMGGEDKTSPIGSLMKHESYVPSAEGVLIYLSISDIEKALSKVERAGGKVYLPKTMISQDFGFMGVFIDTEGNRIALHAAS